MFEFAAFGFVTLVWWTWPAIAGIVFVSMWLVLWLDSRKEGQADSGPYPCLAHLGTEPDGMEWWCWLREGHAGVHLNPWGVDVNQPLVEPSGTAYLTDDGDYAFEPDDYPEQNFHS
jgi:hypothetical protein